MFFGMVFSIRVDIHQHIGIKCQITFFNYHSNPYRIINQIIPYQHCILIHVNMGKRVREFDTLKSKKVPQSLEIGLFFCQIFIFII